MKSFVLLGAALAVLLSTATDNVWAQFVRVYPGGGVRVKAPFVRVEVNPWRGTYVRAPFTEVITPARRYRRWRTPAYTVPDVHVREVPTYENRDPDDSNAVIRSATRQLESDLRRYSDGASWVRYLQPGTIRDLASTDANEPIDGASTGQLREILKRYEEILDSGQPDVIFNLASFRDVHAALEQLLQPSNDTVDRQLSAHATELNRALSRFPNGESWQGHLKLSDPILTGAGNPAPNAGIDEYESLLGRFDAISQSPAYQAIANLPGFQGTHESLASYVRVLRSPPPDPVPVEAAEELPPPPPAVEN